MRFAAILLVLGFVATVSLAPPSPANDPAIAGARSIELPATATDMALGASGRMLIVSIRQLRKIAIIDLQSARVSRYLSVDSDEFDIAAGRNKAVVELRDKRLLQRFDLSSGRLEQSSPLPTDPSEMVMGCDSNGPILIGQDIIDLDTLKRLRVSVSFLDSYRNNAPTPGWGGFTTKQLYARPDGAVFASGKALLVLQADTASVYQDGRNSAPHPDADPLLPAAWTCYADDEPGGNMQSRAGIPRGPLSFLFPAVQPQFVVHLQAGETVRQGVVRGDENLRAYDFQASVLDAVSGTAVANPVDLPEMWTVGSPSPQGTLPPRKRVLADMGNQRLTTLTPDGRHVCVRKLPLQGTAR